MSNLYYTTGTVQSEADINSNNLVLDNYKLYHSTKNTPFIKPILFTNNLNIANSESFEIIQSLPSVKTQNKDKVVLYYNEDNNIMKEIKKLKEDNQKLKNMMEKLMNNSLISNQNKNKNENLNQDEDDEKIYSKSPKSFKTLRKLNTEQHDSTIFKNAKTRKINEAFLERFQSQENKTPLQAMDNNEKPLKTISRLKTTIKNHKKSNSNFKYLNYEEFLLHKRPDKNLLNIDDDNLVPESEIHINNSNILKELTDLNFNININ